MTDWNLIIEDDGGKTIVVPLVRDEITIGRKDGNTIRLTERNISRQHARLSRDNGEVFIEDLKSYNGVRINGDKIAGRVSVAEGDLVEIGDYHLALQAKDASVPKLESPTGDDTQVSKAPSMDEFAGDTQRWVPGASVQASATTQESNHLDSDPTQQQVQVLHDPDAGETKPHAVVGPTPAPHDAPTGQIRVDAPDMLADISIPSSSSENDTVPNVRLPGMPLVDAGETDVHLARPVEFDVSRDRLVAINTEFAGTAFPFDGAEVVVGRDEDADLTVQHQSVSRNHAKLVRDGDGVRVLDLKSSNGVLVNGQEVSNYLLQQGDVIELGRIRLRFTPKGDEFTMSAAEVAAGQRDNGGDEWGDAPGTSLVSRFDESTFRVGDGDAPAGQRKNVLIAVAAGVVVLGALVVWALMPTEEPPAGDDVIVAPSEDPSPTPDPQKQPEPSPGTEPDRGPDEAPVGDPMAKAREAMAAKKWDDAEKLFVQAQQEGAADAAALLERARAERNAQESVVAASELLGEGDPRAALEELTPVLEGGPKGSAAYPEAKTLQTQAKRELSSSLQKDIGAAVKAKKFADAEESLAQLKTVDDPAAKQWRGRIAQAKAKKPSVKRTGDSAAKPKPRRSKKPTEAQKAEAERLVSRAQAMLLTKNYKSAQGLLLKAQRLHKDHAPIYRGLGLAYGGTGSLEQAIRAYRKYLSLSPGAADRVSVQSKIRALQEQMAD